MTIARDHLVDTSLTRWYHCVTHSVRRGFLLGEGVLDRKQWIKDRLRGLAEIFSISVGGLAELPNHFHLVLWPRAHGELSRWMLWLLTTHVHHDLHHDS